MVKLTAEDRTEILLALQGPRKKESVTLLADRYGVSRQAIYDVKRVWKTERRVTSKPPPGQKCKINEDLMDQVVLYAASHPFDSLAAIKNLFNLPYHLSSISMMLIKFGLRSYVAKLKNPLVMATKRKRINFANRNRNLDFDQVVFTDEKTVQNFFNGKVRVRRLRGEGWEDRNVVTVNQQRNCKVNLWGFISKEKCQLFWVDDKYKSVAYKKDMEERFLPAISEKKTKFIFMQDNASIHKELNVMSFFQDANINVLDWPPRSPDLNPIENIWAEMQRLVNIKLLENRINTPNLLFDACEECFSIACRKNVDKLYESVPRRLTQVIVNGGNRTRY